MLGLASGSSENAKVVKDLFSDLALRGVDLNEPRLWVIASDKNRLDSASRSTLFESMLQGKGGQITMPAWQGEPEVKAHITDLYAYLSARAQAGARPAGQLNALAGRCGPVQGWLSRHSGLRGALGCAVYLREALSPFNPTPTTYGTPMIPSRPVFELTLSVPTIEDLGATPLGHRRIATVAGGSFEGERLRGTVVSPPSGDWLLLRSDGVLCLDVRLTLKTDDGALIFMSYKGMRHGPTDVIDRLNKGEAVDPSTYYMRASPVFETSSAKYAWLNRAVFVAIGRRVAAGPVYEVHEVL